MTPDARMLGVVLDTLETAAARDGHLFLLRAELCDELAARLNITADQARVGVGNAAALGHIVMRKERCYLPRLEAAEQRVAEQVKVMLADGPR